MILQALYALSQSRNLVEDPLYEKKRVDFLVRIDADGRLKGWVPTRDERGRGLEAEVPRGPKRASNVATGFLVDNCKYVLGLDAPEKQNDDRLARCREAFHALTSACADETGDRGARAVVRFLEARETLLPEIFREYPRDQWTGSEVLSFSLVGDEHPRIHERPAIRAWWDQRNAPSKDGGPLTRCLVTGRLSLPERLHPPIKRVPQAQSSGASVVSFNAAAFTSHGLSQGANAPVSREATVGYTTALNWLLQSTPQRRFQYGVPLGDDAVLVFWTKAKSEVADVLAALLDPTDDDVRRLAESPWRGLEPSDVDTTNFYALTLSGNAARVVFREWLDVPLVQVKHNLRRYFEDLRIGSLPETPTPIRELLYAVTPPSGRGLSPDLASRLFTAALRGTPFPRELLGAALRRLRLPPDEGNEASKLRLRCALVKATLLRLPRGSKPPREIPVSLDATNVETPYLLGRLFAVLDHLQGKALGKPNATIRDRYFGAASMTPAVVFPRLLRLAVHHAAKANAGWLEGIQGQIVSALPAERFPRLLTQEDQGLFAIGYYHQREDFFRKREPSETSETSEDSESTPSQS